MTRYHCKHKMTTYDGVQHRMAQWIRRLPTEQKIQGSNPCAVIYFFLPFPGKGKGVATLPASRLLYYQCVVLHVGYSCTVQMRYHSSTADSHVRLKSFLFFIIECD